MVVGREAVRLYGSGLSMARIAERLGISPKTVQVRFREMGVGIRPHGNRYGAVLTKDQLMDQYVKRRRPAARIARDVRCSIGTVYYWLRGRDIPRRRRGGRR